MCLLVGRKLSIAPALVLRFLIRFFHQAYNQVLKHLLDLAKWIICSTHSKRREDAAVELRGPFAQEVHGALLGGSGGARPQLSKGSLLNQRRKVFVRSA